MPFNFGGKSRSAQNNGQAQRNLEDEMPKISSTQLSRLTKEFPSWLRDGSALKQLPGIYLGVLGQVQLQRQTDGIITGGHCLVNLSRSPMQSEYMNRFTDTERVHLLLSASQLPNDTLAAIWAHVNKAYPGRLTNREVCLALALIAIFQRLESERNLAPKVKTTKDPFDLIKLEKKPPIPKLYPRDSRSSPKKTISTSQSIPENLNDTSANTTASNCILLIDMSYNGSNIKHHSTSSGLNIMPVNNVNPYNLIDNENDQLQFRLGKLSQIWLKFLTAMKRTFKRSFDVLMVENSRQTSLEALSSDRGIQFVQSLCLCYPLAHNIKSKIDELKNFKVNASEQFLLLDKSYTLQIDDLMTSINEYWAVLINLFNESGQRQFIEVIMDRLNYNKSTITSKSLEELSSELNTIGKSDICSICLTRFYLTLPLDETSNNDNNDKSATLIDSMTNDNFCNTNEKNLILSELITKDSQYYYHTKCANFWLNHVDLDDLPFVYEKQDDILRPTSVTSMN